ncbi:riboflavin biosynthesis pyrimidine reductase [Microbacterium terrae]|uniref:Riboflavin biosynthesis protein RibD n=1 Tax=Microbacterium terrae TaxID=69369 RepID=A0A0M2H6D2_9MICO|nr:pyrimidine reductase family protein [Microbacterium terrae]KJL42047.1 Riboflavin biosynthesis protein RibD [Microbacterium terrae]MBP1076690.1 riboflavin biosynthesis pyrimidine reductase [Microbacterium terrae]GLJ97518.1 hypothetical protein GCM10017594_07150 [Microbacterium terrae]
MLAHDDLTAAYALDDRETPRIRMNFVASVDGAATVAGRSAGLGGDTDRVIMQVLRAMSDVVLVGAGTVRAEGYGGTKVDGEDAAWRRAHGLPEQPRLAVVSRRLDLEPGHPFFRDAAARPLVVTCAAAPADRREALGAVADVMVCGDEAVDLADMRAQSAAAGRTQILCEGGPHLFGALHDARLVDEVCLTLSPRLAGGAAGRIMRGSAEAVADLRLASLLRDDDWLFLRYAR